METMAQKSSPGCHQKSELGFEPGGSQELGEYWEDTRVDIWQESVQYFSLICQSKRNKKWNLEAFVKKSWNYF